MEQCFEPGTVWRPNYDNIRIAVIGIVDDHLFDLTAAHLNLDLNACVTFTPQLCKLLIAIFNDLRALKERP